MNEETWDPAVFEQMMAAERTEDGEFIIVRTRDFIVSMRRMVYNWRLFVATPEEFGRSYSHGYCYFGVNIASSVRAFAAGVEWAKGDPFTDEPEGYEKKAF